MKIWLLNPYGPLPGDEWREYRFAMLLRALADRGHDVTWWTAGFDHYTKRMRSKTWTTIAISERASIRLVPTPPYRRNIGFGRLHFEAHFALGLYRKTQTEEPPDVIVAADPPQTNGVVAVRIARRFGIPIILDCLDLWPEAFAGALPKIARPALVPLRWLRSWTYSRADAAIASCETYRQHLLSNVRSLRPEQTSTVFLGIDTKQIAAGEGSPPEFTVIYAGSLGDNYDIRTVLDAAKLLPRVRFVIAGDGPLREYVVRRVESDGLANTKYVGRVAPDALPALYASASVGLIPYARWSTVAMPVKLFDYLAAGLPFVSSLVGELSDLMQRCDCGIAYRSGDARSLADAIESLAADPKRREEMARNARKCAGQFERDEQYRRFAEVVERVAREHPAHGAR